MFHPTSRIIAYGLGGDDDIAAAGPLNIPTWFYGGCGNDRLNAGDAGGVLFGGTGNDDLIRGSGRDLLIGGPGMDRLVGNGGEDILIGGTTAYDGDHEALCGIYEYWVRTDRTYAQRVADLASGSYAAGFAMSAKTVFDDLAIDLLTGSSGDDWFLPNTTYRIRDRLTGVASAETVTQATGVAEL
jgi:Ca2+-binding RTX toxin-like protein